jgi:hypothetical protein
LSSVAGLKHRQNVCAKHVYSHSGMRQIKARITTDMTEQPDKNITIKHAIFKIR